MFEKKNKYKYKIVLAIFIALLLIIGITYALWFRYFMGTKEQEITTGKLELVLTDESAGVSLLNTTPVSDNVGMSFKPYTFKIRNYGTIPATYKVYLIDDESSYYSDQCNDKKMPWDNIKYSLKENDNINTGNLSKENNGLLLESSINPDEVNNYYLNLWIRSEATTAIANYHFHAKIKVEAIYE